MKIKGEPLQVKFTHVNNDSVKKTIARCKVRSENVPYLVYNEFFDLFQDKSKNFEWDCYASLYAETTCKDSDKYDPAIGEKIARKKIMKKFMSMIRKAADYKLKEKIKEENEIFDLLSFAMRCENDIVKYLREQ